MGVEGLSREIILQALNKCGAFEEVRKTDADRRKFSSVDLFNLGLTGTEGSAERKKEFLRKLNLPEYLSNKALLDYLNSCDEEIIKDII